MWGVRFHPEAEPEYDALDAREALALRHAISKLKALGPRLDYPHSSAVQGADRLRELRPRQGRSPSRALYRRIGRDFVIGAIGPEAEHDRRGFKRVCRDAERRLEEVE